MEFLQQSEPAVLLIYWQLLLRFCAAIHCPLWNQSRCIAYKPPFCAGGFAVGATESGRSRLRRALFMSALQ